MKLKTYLFFNTGKGLGKNENGIRIPVKLMTNQNKTGIGYDEHKPWWDRVYNDTVKNIKTECNDGKFSLMSVTDTATSKTNYQNFWKKSETLSPSEQIIFGTCSDSENLCEETSECMINQKTELCYNKTMHEPTEHNFTSNGKLERIAQQDALYLNTNPLLSDSIVHQKNDIDRNEKSDIKNIVLSKEIAKHKDKISTLMELSILEKSVIRHLEKNNNRMQNYLDMKKKVGAQRMKKDKYKKEKKNLKKMMSLYNSMTSDALGSTNEVKITGGLFYQHTRLIQDKLLKIKKKSINQTSDILPDVKLLGLERKREKGKDSIEHKVDQSLKMGTVIDNKADESFKKDWTIVDFAKTDKERENFDCKAIFPSKAAIDRRFEKEKAKNKYNNPIEEINRDFCCLSLKKKRTKKNLRPPSKGIMKITEKLRSEALANELNSAIQKLTIFQINSTDKLNANTVKEKFVVPTQTHFMPV
ncbi:G patch domain-containing protein 4 [Trachymyrmex septentrionalis]|uniref:G patch domain-containing protein 4 n=1 Tax=Trachymyrmex septentrionalis TaxID=34720 RepID=A0A195F774_9HYME|nr:G patch domain-containing protein 4 [Trachymyrmex septentrionalis]